MAQIELVIKIDEDEYKAKQRLVANPKALINTVDKAIANGTVLPKGHGDLVNVNDLSLMTVHLVDGVFVCLAPTIIKADEVEI